MDTHEDTPFEDLPKEKQVELVQEEMKRPGASYLETALRLGTTRGRVARICQDYEIKSTNPEPPHLAAARAARKLPPPETPREE